MATIKLEFIHKYRDRHKKVRYYFRRKGMKKVPLPGVPFSREFMDVYQACLDSRPPPVVPGASRTTPGTFNALIVQYYQSSRFTALAESTRSTYRGQLEAFRAKHGNKRVAMLEPRHVDGLLGELAGKSTAQAHKLRKRLSTLMRLAVKWGYTSRNPMHDAERVVHKSKGYRTWTDDDISKFRAFWPLGSSRRTAFEIMLYTGLRRSDAVRLGPQHVQDGFIVFRTKKSQEMVELAIPLHDEFQAFLDDLKTDHLTFVVTEYGASRSEKGFTNWIIEAARQAGLPPHSSPHGVRKAACRKLAEAGATALEIMAITGHRNLKEIETYCAAVNRRRLAERAVAKRSGAE